MAKIKEYVERIEGWSMEALKRCTDAANSGNVAARALWAARVNGRLKLTAVF